MKKLFSLVIFAGLLSWALLPFLYAAESAVPQKNEVSLVSFNAVDYSDKLVHCQCYLDLNGKELDVDSFVPPDPSTHGSTPDAFTQMSTCSKACTHAAQIHG